MKHTVHQDNQGLDAANRAQNKRRNCQQNDHAIQDLAIGEEPNPTTG